ncbi:Uncharacterised protein [Acidipropionibacterium jensenii]|uniref:DUF6418 domain-containing protein n=1 Tax=Acidipropionibacterium jensenii TaxID=1749 RepID=A0A448NYH3_9ACTN|nr:DUF6418 domain-containing protein [Acidipropionibacterium jensenii]VEI02987.1 Uncharacterised protein [Acidipropionibacterium jensenii]
MIAAAVLPVLVLSVVLWKVARVGFYAALLLVFAFWWQLLSVIYIESHPGLLLVSTWSVAQSIGASWALSWAFSSFLAGTLLVVWLGSHHGNRHLAGDRTAGASLPPSSGPALEGAPQPDHGTVGPTTLQQRLDGGSSTELDGGNPVDSPAPKSSLLAGSGKFPLAVAFTAALYAFVDAVISPNALTGAGDVRATFYQTASLPFALELSVGAPVFAVMAGIVAVRNKPGSGLRKISYLVFLMGLVTLYLTGVEFTGYVQHAFSFFLPAMLVQSDRLRARRDGTRRRLSKWWGVGAVMVGAFALFKLLSFRQVTIYSEVAGSTLSRFMYRAFALQGEVFWATFAKFGDAPVFSQLSSELQVLAGRAPSTQSGIYVLMDALSPSGANQAGYTLNSGYPAILIYIFGSGLATVGVCFLGGLLFGLIALVVAHSILRGSMLLAACGYGVLYSLYLAFTMGGALYISSRLMYVSLVGLVIAALRQAGTERESEPDKLGSPGHGSTGDAILSSHDSEVGENA